MLRTVTAPMIRLVERWLPGSLVFAVLLTVVVAGMALTLTESGPVDTLVAWGDGLTGLLAFMTQMALVLLLGHVLAHTRPVHALLVRVASLPQTPAQAYGFVAFCAAVASLVTWGLGLVVAAVLSIEVAEAGRRRGLKLHFPLLVAAGYSGFVVWHMGYSGSGPLAAATPGSFVEELLGGTVPITATLFSWWNLAGAALTVVAVTGTMMLLRPAEGSAVIELPADAVTSSEAGRAGASAGEDTPADRLDGSRAVTMVIGLLLLGYLAVYFGRNGLELTLDIVNWTFLCLVLLLVDSPRHLGRLVADAASNVGDILLQFPLYAGILGMMKETGLIAIMSDFFVAISTETTLGLWAFLAGGLVNLFVPSGGGQFAVQAPIFLDAAQRLGVDPAVVIMGIAYGDQWTNMIQPFWALPLLAMARLRIREVVGYTTVTLLVSGVIFAGVMLVASL